MNKLERQVPETSFDRRLPVRIVADALEELRADSPWSCHRDGDLGLGVAERRHLVGDVGERRDRASAYSTILMLVPTMNFLNQKSYDLAEVVVGLRSATVVPLGYLVLR